MANLLGDVATRADVEAYRTRLNAGGEMSSSLDGARLSLAVTLDDDGLAQAATRSMDDLWSEAAGAWNATHPGDPCGTGMPTTRRITR